MDQDRTVSKVLFELKQMGIIDILQTDEVRKRLEWVYASGFDSGRVSHHTPVNQYDKYGKFIRTFDNLSLAANAVKKDSSAVKKCAQGRTKFCAGFIFRYAEEKKTA